MDELGGLEEAISLAKAEAGFSAEVIIRPEALSPSENASMLVLAV